MSHALFFFDECVADRSSYFGGASGDQDDLSLPCKSLSTLSELNQFDGGTVMNNHCDLNALRRGVGWCKDFFSLKSGFKVIDFEGDVRYRLDEI
jgi:hypothetical protein